MVEGIASPTQRLPALALVLNINSSVRKSLIFPKFRSKTPSRSLHFAFSGRPWPSLSPKASESLVEPATDVKFQTTVKLPGCSDSLALFGTGFREKYFAIIGVKVYAVGLYMNPNIQEYVSAWKDKSAEQIQNDVSLFTSLFQAPSEKSLQIVLVRDVDGKTFWDALDDAISPRITTPTSIDEAAVSTFGNTFQGRPLKKGTLIFLTWAQPSKMLISISENGLPSNVDASIESMNVTSALFDVFFGDGPVSPTLKASVASGLAAIL